MANNFVSQRFLFITDPFRGRIPKRIFYFCTKKNGFMRGQPELYRILEELNIPFDYHEHPPVPTVEEASKYWKGIDSAHCKNIFFRNHKGNRHYLVIIDYRQVLDIHDLEKRLRQGKLSFASERRLKKYLGLTPGSVTPFGLINDRENHVYVFLDENLRQAERISFHPCINTASLVLPMDDFIRFLDHTGNKWEFTRLYNSRGKRRIEIPAAGE